MKLHLIVVGFLVIGWVSARPTMPGSPPVEVLGKNNTKHITDSDKSGNVKDEIRANGGTKRDVVFQGRATNNGDTGADTDKNDSRNESIRNGLSQANGNSDNGKQLHEQINDIDGQNKNKNDHTEGKPIVQISVNKENFNEQQGSNNTQKEIIGQNGAPTKTLNAAEKQSNGSAVLTGLQSSSSNVPQYLSNNSYPSVVAGNLNDPNKTKGVHDNSNPSAAGPQNVNPPSFKLLNNNREQNAIPPLGSNIVGTNRPEGSQGSGIQLLDQPSGTGINFNQGTTSAGSVNQGSLSEQSGNKLPNYISQQRPGNPSSGQGLSGGQVLSPLTTSFIGTRPREEQLQGSSDSITSYFPTNSIGGGAIPVKETPLVPTGNNVYYYPTGSNGGSTKPFKETNPITSSNTLNYSPLTASNIGSSRPNDEILQGSFNNVAVILPGGNVGDNKIPSQQVYQGTSGGTVSSAPQQESYANAGLVKDTNQGFVRPGTLANIGNEIPLFGGSGSQSDFQNQKLYSSDSSYKPATLNPSSSLLLNDFKVGPQSGNNNLKDSTKGNPISGTPAKDFTNSVNQNPEFGINYGQHQDQFATSQGSSFGNFPYPSGGNSALVKPYKDSLGSGGITSSFSKFSYDAFGNYIGGHLKVFEDDGYQFGSDGSPEDGVWRFTEPIH